MTKLCKCGKDRYANLSKCYQCYRSHEKEKKQERLEHKKIRKEKIKSKKEISTKSLDILWSKATKILLGGKCEYCGSTEYLNSHHIYSRSNHNMRWMIENCVLLCAKHHALSTIFSAHLAPVEFTEWITELRGKEFMNALKLKARQMEKVDLVETRAKLLEIIACG